MQKALTRSLRRWRSVRNDDVMAYFRKVMVNIYITRWRRWTSRVQPGDVPDSGADDPAIGRSEDWDLLRRALARLPARQRAVLVLRYYEDLPDARIAALMGYQPGTVKSQAVRGLAALRPLLAPESVPGGPTMIEDRLRELLNDSRWSLSARLTETRVRRAARRQRLAIGSAAAIGTAAIVAAVAVPSALLSGPPSKVAPGAGSRPALNASATPRSSLAAPPVGASGFPASIYPAPQPHPVVDAVGLCPGSDGLQAPGPSNGTAALRVANELGRSFLGDLHLADRAFWPVIVRGWQPGGTRVFTPGRQQPVLYSGPLESYHSSKGPPDLASAISAGCGGRLARDVWMIVTGPRTSPALQGESLFLTRRGHVLLYYAQ